ncbi:GNAT family N-acetyltransferase [Halobacillus hunanensis]|uniref:GNAT family N-acetyltransferase n=1 Tax=Halobacillus hunanensis TaxID=578214 RepID=UPI0009A7E695|nr:GNAT family N-acetyltransferase [Halobacillus hunanensis]
MSMTINLRPMNKETFNSYYQTSIEDYAEQHVIAGNWKEEDARLLAKNQFEQLLPNGLHTNEHTLFSIHEDEVNIGVLWLHVYTNNGVKQMFIYDIKLDENQRGNGYGTSTMETLEDYAQGEEVKQIQLHVFAHNKRAIALYKKVGYEVSGNYMIKNLS